MDLEVFDEGDGGGVAQVVADDAAFVVDDLKKGLFGHAVSFEFWFELAAFKRRITLTSTWA
ncbi:hypothetical protein PAMC26510_21325 [Caballeronia sordidicola]|uniref:Uncharacterized protein n=1 Tax=Caballeronia sordidicola TaxID=196367 RepID=A0A242MMG4_CABSO|nr:hypothetical protein PAMC26510_21325 [Caballeronia sordidicola]